MPTNNATAVNHAARFAKPVDPELLAAEPQAELLPEAVTGIKTRRASQGQVREILRADDIEQAERERAFASGRLARSNNTARTGNPHCRQSRCATSDRWRDAWWLGWDTEDARLSRGDRQGVAA